METFLEWLGRFDDGRAADKLKTFDKSPKKKSINEMAWAINSKSIDQYRRWKEAIKIDSQFLRVINWEEVLQYLKSKPDLHQQYMDLSAREQNGWSDDEWASKKYIRDNSDVVLAKVDPCKFMEARNLTVTNPDPSWYKEKFSSQDYDPGLPLAMVSSKKVLLFDGNHRMQAACELGQYGYVAIAYFIDYDSVKHTVVEIIES